MRMSKCCCRLTMGHCLFEISRAEKKNHVKIQRQCLSQYFLIMRRIVIYPDEVNYFGGLGVCLQVLPSNTPAFW